MSICQNCPYDAACNYDCEYWYSTEDDPDFNDDVDEAGFNPFIGGYDYDC